MSTGVTVLRYTVGTCLFGSDWLKIFVPKAGMFSAQLLNAAMHPEFLVYPDENGPMDFGYEFPQVSAKIITDHNTYKMPWGELRRSHNNASAPLRRLLKQLVPL